MSLVGKIQSLFLDREKTQPIFPITKVKAVSDDNGKGLNVLLDDKASKDFVTAKIAEAQLGGGGGEIDLSGFATKDDLNAVNDKIPTTPEQIGAHPNTWMPTASDVGAAPAGHVTDKNNPHGVTPAQIGAAPAGYGLGGEAKKLTSADDVNTTWQSGWYHWGESAPQNAPKISAYGTGYGAMQVDGANATNFIQTVCSGYSNVLGAQLRRRVVEGVDRGWEWVTPRMELGVEYRTTERWNGKAVYTKLVDCGTMPNNTDKTVTTTIHVNTEIVRFDVVYKNKNGNFMSNPMVDYTTGDIFCRLTITNTGNIAIRTYADVTDVTAMCRVWYTKD